MKDPLETFLSTLSIWSGRDKSEFIPLRPFIIELMHEPKYVPYLLLNREELENILLKKPDTRFLFRILRHEEGWLGISYRKIEGTIMHGAVDLNSFLPDVPSLDGLVNSLQDFMDRMEKSTYGTFFGPLPKMHPSTQNLIITNHETNTQNQSWKCLLQ